MGAGNSSFVGTVSSSGVGVFNILNDPDPAALDTNAQGINNAAQVVGFWDDAVGDDHGFIASPASLPCGTTVNGGFVFCVGVVASGPIFLDPLVATGYEYAVGAGDPDFASVTLPIGIGDSMYTLDVGGDTFSLAGGQLFDFLTNGFPDGVAAFEVLGIETSAMLNPSDPTAFVTEVTFTRAGEFTGTMTPITTNVPEPATLALLGIGLAGLGFSRRKQ